uniref:Kinesin motor domain-containing protein n=1 Tax=Macrostomum lignano TaxID=282301 RepID=A0A1I8F6J6_9PLAT
LDANVGKSSVQLVPGAQVSPGQSPVCQGLSGGHKSAQIEPESAMRSAVPRHTRVYSTPLLDAVSVCSCCLLPIFRSESATGQRQIRKSRQQPLAELHSALRQLHARRLQKRAGDSHTMADRGGCGLRPHIRCSTKVVSDSEETGCGQRFGQLVKIAAVLGESVTRNTSSWRLCARCSAQQSLKLLGPLTPRSKKYQTANATVDKKPHRGRFFSDGEWQEACDDRDSGERDIWPSEQQEESSNKSGDTFDFHHQQQQQLRVLSVSTEAVQLSHQQRPPPRRLPPIRKAASTSQDSKDGDRLLHSEDAEGKNLRNVIGDIVRQTASAARGIGRGALARCCGSLNGLKSSVWSTSRPSDVQNSTSSCPRRQFR